MISRRTLLTTGAAGAVALAGCLGLAARPDADCAELPTEPDYRGWFDDVQTYHGTCDARATSRPQPWPSAPPGNNGGYWGFDPEAIAVLPGTTVTWEWTGNGGAHDVTSADGTFASGRPVDEADATYERVFDEPGIYRYVCGPHERMGMKGAVFVALE